MSGKCAVFKYPKITTKNEWADRADRMEMVLKILTGDTVGATTITVDHRRAHRAIKYFRQMAAGRKRGLTAEWNEMIQFCGRHHVDMNWLMEGDMTTMVLTLAMHTSSRDQPRLRIV